jgi:predicted RNA-binding protein with PIN domain
MRYLLVDGHSVIYSWPELRETHRLKPAQAREELIRRLQPLHDSGDWAVTLVFDGRQGAEQVRRDSEMLVAYATADQTADSLIEKLVGAHAPQGKEIVVVTADEAERLTVESLGAQTMSPEFLQAECVDLTERIQLSLRDIHKKAR